MSTARLDAPFIMWTLQRTGGTNLNNALNALSACRRMQDEAFNPERKCGHLTAAWRRSRDDEALLEAVRELCAEGYNFKHCAELVPWAVSKALATATVEHGYHHLFLYRQDPVQRILSREYARRTEIWGPKQAAALAQGDDAAAFADPLDIEAVLAHEALSHRRLNRVWSRLRQSAAGPVAISFEELYADEADITRRSLKCLFYDLGLLLPRREFEEVLRRIRATGNQHTRDRYGRFQGIAALEERAGSLPALTFARRL